MSRIAERFATKTRESVNDLAELTRNTLQAQVIDHHSVDVLGDDVVITGANGTSLTVTSRTFLDIDHRLVTVYSYGGIETANAHDIALHILRRLR